MGGEAYGPNPEDEVLFEAVRAGLDAGIGWIDTAEVYGKGRSETLIGQAIAGRRDEVFLATKVGPRPGGTGFQPDEVRKALDKSLARLGVSHVDLYQLHWPDERGVPVEDTWGAMAGLVDDGKVRHIGVSNFDRELISRCESIRHVDSLQPQFSMLQLENRELITWCGERGIGVVPYGALGFGLLTGAITASTEFHKEDWRSGRTADETWRELFAPGKLERSLAVVDGLRPIAERSDASVSQLALAWTFHQPGVTSAIAGSRNPSHTRSNAEAGDLVLDAEDLAQIEELLPLGPSFG
jgi:aryl-alcohol dehydrogenase-like predicted oxidoreductase